MTDNPLFFHILTSKNILTNNDVNELLQRFQNDGLSVVQHLVKHGVSTRDELGKIWGDSLNKSYINLKATFIDTALLHQIPRKFCEDNKLIPVYEMNNTITVAMANPYDIDVIQFLQDTYQKFISSVFAFSDDIQSAIQINFQTQKSLNELIEKFPLKKFENIQEITSVHELKQLANDQIIIDFVKNLICFAIKERTSDIHVEPSETSVRVRFRIDGVLQERIKLSPVFHQPLISHIKILAETDIVEKRRPHDGHISFRLSDGPAYDIRFSSVPTVYGEKAVLRILDPFRNDIVPDLNGMDFSFSTLNAVKKVLTAPNGSFFVTGPTGSGKTTTLYSILKYLNKPGVNIMTAEDPVEYRLPGLNQVQVHSDIGLDFASILRSFLRQDPDIILIGEIRDMETAKISAQAALTGHLVFATMHTNSSLQAVIRLIEIGVAPFLVAPSIIGVMGQRLVRRICPHCKESYPLTAEEIEKIFIWDKITPVTFYRGKGCFQCSFTGYHGRIAIHEICLITEEMRALVSQNAPFLEIQKCALSQGFKPMRYDGMKKVLRGLTTFEELNRVTFYEED